MVSLVALRDSDGSAAVILIDDVLVLPPPELNVVANVLLEVWVVFVGTRHVLEDSPDRNETVWLF